ncbi:MAG: metallophosphoesterase family protein [Firmicutes bacterium]|nr:metallophosphoesterase family protein [Bacillota bacterium]
MKFLIISDTHGGIQDARRLIENLHDQIDGVWHLGDEYRDFEMLQRRYGPLYGLAFQAVPGNCDYFSPAPNRRDIPVCGHKVLMSHGHMYGVFGGTGLGSLPSEALKAGCDVALYGHTHMPNLARENGILYLNPGSLSRPRGGFKKSYALLTLEEGIEASAELFTL